MVKCVFSVVIMLSMFSAIFCNAYFKQNQSNPGIYTNMVHLESSAKRMSASSTGTEPMLQKKFK